MGFIEEFRKLNFISPKPHSRSLVLNENCEYTYYVSESKNLYYTFDFFQGEDCYYCDWGIGGKNCVDCSHIQASELCYQCLDCTNCYNSNFLWECHYAQESSFCFDCRNIKYCFLCTDLRNKEFHIENKPYTKEAYFQKVKQILADSSIDNLRQKFLDMAQESPRIAVHLMKTENVVGDFVYESKNCYLCFDALAAQDCSYLYDSGLAKDSCDLYLADGDLNYELIECEYQCYNCNFCIDSNGCRDSEFLNYCFQCKNCFGCCSIKDKEFHILNKPYSREEYLRKITEIKQELRGQNLYSLALFTIP